MEYSVSEYNESRAVRSAKTVRETKRRVRPKERTRLFSSVPDRAGHPPLVPPPAGRKMTIKVMNRCRMI